MITAKTILEPARQIPLAADVDVLVCGGGPTGMGAALAAARCGAKVLVIERHGMLGGVWTAGLLNPFFDTRNKGWLLDELVSRLKAGGAWLEWLTAGTFDTEAMKITLEQMMAEAGIDFWYHSFIAEAIVEGETVRGVFVESKSGREAVLARVIIDCTGDGDVCARAGVPFDLGRDGDGLCQPMTLMCELTGVGSDFQKSSQLLYDEMITAIEKNKLNIRLPFERCNYAPWIIHFPRPDTADIQATHAYGYSAIDTRDLTKATVDTRRQAHDIVTVLRQIERFKNVRLTQTAPAIGVREGRRIKGQYTLDLEDLRLGRHFDDAVTFGAFNVDIHSVKGPKGDPKSKHEAPMKPYEIPYRCLLPQNRDNLLMAGRCISGTHEAHASYRVTGTCFAMGQGAGLAAALAASEKKSPRQLCGETIHNELKKKGAGFLP